MTRPEATVRLAGPADDAALCELFGRITMDADLRLAVDRTPSFFALYALQRLRDQRVFVAEVEGGLEGVATFLAREAWVEGRRATIGYLGDLRLAPALRGGFFFGRRFGPTFSEALSECGAEVALTAVIRSNEAAIRFLTRRSRRFPDQPVYRPWRRFEILNVHFTRRRRPRPTALEVRPATAADLPAIAARLAADHRARPFGYPLDQPRLEERLARWPGLAVEDFVTAWRGRDLVGVLAPWDAGAVKRFRVEAYRGSMRWVRAAFNVGALLLRYPPLPPAGEPLRYRYLTHVSVVDEDPSTFAALLDWTYAHLHGRGDHFLTACVLEGDPLAPAFARYRTTAVPAQLFTVSPPGSPWNERDPGPGRPGFEMALV